MDFFAAQEHARKQTKWLVLLYMLTVVCIIALLYFAFAFWLNNSTSYEEVYTITWWRPQLLSWVSLGVLTLVIGATFYKIKKLGSGGSAVAYSLGATKVSHNTKDAGERRLLNVVEEMSIASGVPMPAVFVMPEESGINAFAAGYSINDAVVAVTRGALEKLSRDELQGVIAHEFSHILNGDMRLNIRLIGVLFGILCLAVIGREAIFSCRHMGRSRDGAKGALVVLAIGLLFMAVGYIGVFFARIIQSAISRQREYLADAAAVQFTRYPEGLAGALKKLGRRSYRSRITNPHAEEASHLFFAMGLNSFFASHPPLDKRIRAIVPDWDGNYDMVTDKPRVEFPEKRSPEEVRAMLKEKMQPRATHQIFEQSHAISPAQLVFAQAILAALSEDMRAHLKDPKRAQAFIFVLLLDYDEAVRDKQLALIREHAGEEHTAQLMKVWEASYTTLDHNNRLPLLEMALSSLTDLPEAERNAFRQQLQTLADADGQISPFEFVLLRLVRRYLDGHSSRKQPLKKLALPRLRNQLSLAASYVAHLECEDSEQVKAQLQEALKKTPQLKSVITYTPLEGDGTLKALDEALDQIARANFHIRKEFLTLCAEIIQSDGVVSPQEVEFIRAIACGLDCPMPPVQPNAA